MDARTGAAAANTNIFEPLSDFVQEAECDTLLVYLPGFTKEQLRVQLTKSGLLKISGTRPTGENKWSSFQKDFPVSANCDTTKITAKFEDGILYVRQPKLIVPANNNKEDKKDSPSKAPHEPPPAPKPDQEQAPKQKEPAEDKEAKPTKDVPESSKKTDERISNDQNQENVSGKNETSYVTGKAKLDDYKVEAESPAYRLKMARQKVTVAVALLLAFALGMYISNLLSVFFRKTED
ncbi:HSP20-like chaperones superfamily protein [Striga hermonthica]|uniref:HSP20-like chaperones superfamily protein n=1 Tax=Striga hermonthica TaxID=68872 RepID=A0A9N7QYQ5_STRHE|nr:HSP20-like chaperones superfamily protein [Striga hermonthica]